MDSIIFDLDGTLWDPREVVVEAWNKVLKQYTDERMLTQQDLKNVMGLQQKEIGQKLFPHLSEHQYANVAGKFSAVECERLSREGGRLYEGVERVLEQLSEKYELYIVSNCQEGYIESFYTYHELDKHFVDFENPGRTGLSKGENIELIMKRNHIESAIYVGDTEGDQQAAQAAGIPFVYAAYGFGDVEGYDYAIERPQGLVDLFLR